MMRAFLFAAMFAAWLPAQAEGEAKRLYDTAVNPLSALREWTAKHPGDGDGWYFRGLTERECRLLADAARSFDQAAIFLGDDIRPRTAKAALQLRQGRLGAAIAAYDEALRLDRSAGWIEERRNSSAKFEESLARHRRRVHRTLAVVSILAASGFVALWIRSRNAEPEGRSET